MSLHRMRQRYRELLREEVASTVDVPSEIDDEIRNLMTIISRCDSFSSHHSALRSKSALARAETTNPNFMERNVAVAGP